MIKRMKINKDNIYLISDIHANLDLFKEILKDISFSKDDTLFILGDLFEKGDKNIETIDFIMDLEKNYNVYTLVGNCDLVLNEFKRPCNSDKLKKYSLILKKTILNEFLEGIGQNIDEDFDYNPKLDIINQKYKKYFDYINNMNKGYVINDNILLLHANIEESLKKHILTKEEIDNIELKDLNVCGHLPVMINDSEKNYISIKPRMFNDFLYIDGGNNVVPFGCLNLVKLNLKDLSYTYKHYFNLDKYIATSNQDGNSGIYHALKYEYDSYEIIDDIVKYKKDDLIMYGPRIGLLKINDKIYGYDTTNILLDIKKGDMVYVSNYSKDYSFVVKNDLCGLVKSNILKKL